MKGKSKSIFLIFILLVIVTMFACKRNHSGVDTDYSKQGNKSDMEEQQKELIFWSVATENDSFHNAFEEAIKDYEKTYTNVKIIHETFETEEYKEKIKDAALADGLPDIFFSWGGEFSRSFIDSDRGMDLSPFFNDEYRESLPKIALTNAIYDERLYGVTYTTPVSVLFFNKKMFDQNKLLPPETWEEWVKISDTFIEKGIKPFGVSIKDTWVLAMYLDALILKNAGPEKTYQILSGGDGRFYDPDILSPIKKLREWMERGAFIGGATELTNEEVSALFYDGNIPMFVTGSWMASSIATEAENPEDFWVAPIPVLNPQNAKITDFMGGGVDMLMVAEDTRYPDVAGEVVFELARSISKYAYLDGVGIAAWKIDYDDSEVHPIAKQIADYTARATSFTLWFDTFMEMEDAGKYLSLLGKLYDGNITPKHFAREMAEQLEK